MSEVDLRDIHELTLLLIEIIQEFQEIKNLNKEELLQRYEKELQKIADKPGEKFDFMDLKVNENTNKEQNIKLSVDPSNQTIETTLDDGTVINKQDVNTLKALPKEESKVKPLFPKDYFNKEFFPYILSKKDVKVSNNGEIQGMLSKIPPQIAIPLKIGGEMIKSIGQNAFKGLVLKDVSFPSGLSDIKAEAFADNQLENLDLKDTNIKHIDQTAFTDNPLKSVVLPDGLDEKSKKGLLDIIEQLDQELEEEIEIEEICLGFK